MSKLIYKTDKTSKEVTITFNAEKIKDGLERTALGTINGLYGAFTGGKLGWKHGWNKIRK